jgi:stringent starvation protein B
VHVDASVQVPMEYVKNNEIVLNVGFEATSGLKLGNEFIEFKARFGGVARDRGAGRPRGGHLRPRERPGHGLSGAQRACSRAGRNRAGAAAAEVRVRGVRAAAPGTTDADAPGGGAERPATPEPPPPGGPKPALKRVK